MTLPKGARIVPGETFKVTFYWRLDKPLGPGFRLLTRVHNESGETLLNGDSSGPLRERRNRKPAWSPSDWTVGKIYVDEQVLKMPPEMHGKFVRLVVGIRKGDVPLKPGSGVFDRRGYLTVAELPIDTRPPSYQVVQLTIPMIEQTETIDIDGEMKEPAWKTAARLPSLLDMVHDEIPSTDAKFSAEARLLWDVRGLYLGVRVRDADVQGGFVARGDELPLWKRDALEMVLKSGDKPNNENYYRIAVNPQNLVFDSFYRELEIPDGSRRGFGDTSWQSGVKVATSVSGTLEQPEDEDEGYGQELFIPWASLNHPAPFVPLPGASIWFNFAVYSQGTALGFSPYLGDGLLQFARDLGKLVLNPQVASSPVSKTATASTSNPAPSLPTRIGPLTAELPTQVLEHEAALVAAHTAAELARVAAERALVASPDGAATPPPAGPANPAADGAPKPAPLEGAEEKPSKAQPVTPSP
ncbi:MAG: carbohydrate-binding family 9-like protein [Polyangiaceae bacterium]